MIIFLDEGSDNESVNEEIIGILRKLKMIYKMIKRNNC